MAPPAPPGADAREVRAALDEIGRAARDLSDRMAPPERGRREIGRAMRRPSAGKVAAWAAGTPLAALAGLVVAPALEGGLSLPALAASLADPLSAGLVPGSARCAALFAAVYAACAAAWLLTRRNLRPGEEHGSARWGDARRICHRYRGRDPAGDKLLTRNFRMSYDTHAHRRSMNTLVVGGSGAGKTRGFSLPNACQANTSMVVLDPKGEIVRAVGGLLESRGYEVRVLDLVRMERSHCYNPLSYIESDADAQRLNTNLFKATTPKGAQSQDPFWDTAAGMLHLALLLYLVHEAPPEERNYATLMEMLRAGEVREDDDDYASVLDELFDRLEMRDPGHIALKYYRSYRSGSAKTLKSIQVTLASRLEKFNLDALASLTATDELDLPSLGSARWPCSQSYPTTTPVSTSWCPSSTRSCSSSFSRSRTENTAGSCPCTCTSSWMSSPT